MTGSTSFQLLACQVDIHYEHAALETVFRYLPTRARQPFGVRTALRYDVFGDGPYELREEGDPLGHAETPADALYIVYGRVHRRVLERFVLSGWAVLHAVVATINDQRTMILGDKGAGKTTLATRLLYAGHQVEGDEMALVRDETVLALPRLFHLKPAIEQQIPELEGRVADLPKAYAGSVEISALDPADFGFDWSISMGPIDRVVWITANHGGESRLEPRPSFAAIQRVLECSLGWAEAREVLVAAAAKIGRAGGWELTLGDTNESLALLEETPH